MAKVLNKALDILEYFANDPETPKRLGQITGDIGLNETTCVRILKTLVNRHYVDQPVPRGGYTLGPMSYNLSSRGVYRKDITQVAAPIVAKCARQIGEYVMVASYCQGKRFVLAVTNGNPELRIGTDLGYFGEIYATATGRLLLAFEPPEVVEEHIKAMGLPKGLWGGINSLAALKMELAKIRKTGFCVDFDREQTVAFAYPIYDGDNVISVLGVALLKSRFRGKHKKEILQAARRSAEEITTGISRGEKNARSQSIDY